MQLEGGMKNCSGPHLVCFRTGLLNFLPAYSGKGLAKGMWEVFPLPVLFVIMVFVKKLVVEYAEVSLAQVPFLWLVVLFFFLQYSAFL